VSYFCEKWNDPYDPEQESDQIWANFQDRMFDVGFDKVITYGFSLTPVFETKLEDTYLQNTTSYRANEITYLTGGRIDLEVGKNLVLDQNFIKRDPLVYALHAHARATLLGLDFLDDADPNRNVEAYFFGRLFETLGSRNALMVPMKSLSPIPSYGFGLHSSLGGANLKQIMNDKFDFIIAACMRFSRAFDQAYRREFAHRRGISPQQLRVLQCVTGGLTNRATANMLGVRETTVSFHLKKLQETLEVNTTRELPMVAIKLGLVPLL